MIIGTIEELTVNDCTEWAELPIYGFLHDYYPNGKLLRRQIFKDGKRHGLFEDYYMNGQLWERGYFKNGKAYGDHEYYERDGQLRWCHIYKDDIQQ